MDLSIIIVNWNTREHLAQCLASIYANPPLGKFEIWVVDNASSDGSTQMVREKFPTVSLMENFVNAGFGRANNLGIHASSGAYLLFLNSDTVVIGDALSRLCDFASTQPGLGVLGASLLNPDGTPQKSYSRFPSLWSEAIFAFGLDRRIPTAIHSVAVVTQGWNRCDCVSGAAFLVPRGVLDIVGGFDEKFFMYSEEIDLQLRVHHAGFAIGVLPTATLFHFGGASAARSAPAMKAELFHSKDYFFRKHHSPASAFALRRMYKASILGRIARYHVVGDECKKKFWLQAWKILNARQADPRND